VYQLTLHVPGLGFQVESEVYPPPLSLSCFQVLVRGL